MQSVMKQVDNVEILEMCIEIQSGLVMWYGLSDLGQHGST